MTATIPLGELVSIRGGGTPSRAKKEFWGGPIPWATVKDFKTTSLDSTQESITEDGVKKSATNIVPAGSIVVPTRMAVGKAAINTIEVAINQDLKALLPKGEINTRFLLHFMLSKSDFLEGQAQGATVKGIKLDLLKSLPFPDLPLNEQRRIAAILDKADAIRRKRKQALDLVDDLADSFFSNFLYNQRENVRQTPLADIASSERSSFVNGPFGSNLLTSELTSEGVPVIYIRDIRNTRYERVSSAFVTNEKAEELHSCGVKAGDILIAKVGDPPGTTAIYPPNESDGIVTQDVIRLRLDPKKARASFVRALINSSIGKHILASITVQATRARFGLRDLKKTEFPILPLEMQVEFERIAEKHRELRQSLALDFSDSALLFSALSQQAFRGEL